MPFVQCVSVLFCPSFSSTSVFSLPLSYYLCEGLDREGSPAVTDGPPNLPHRSVHCRRSITFADSYPQPPQASVQAAHSPAQSLRDVFSFHSQLLYNESAEGNRIGDSLAYVTLLSLWTLPLYLHHQLCCSWFLPVQRGIMALEEWLTGKESIRL